jgi:hypothetical protein
MAERELWKDAGGGMAVPTRAMEPVNAFLKLKNGLKMKIGLPEEPKHSSSALVMMPCVRRRPDAVELARGAGVCRCCPLFYSWFSTDPFFCYS